MSCECLTAEQLIARKAIGEGSTDNGASSTAVSFKVWGFHALLRVMVYVYWQRKSGTNPTSSDTWIASAIKRDPNGEVRTLQSVFASRSLQDGHEVNSGAEGILYTCTFGNPGANKLGTWWVEVKAQPAVEMSEELFQKLCQRIAVEVPDKVATIPDEPT